MISRSELNEETSTRFALAQDTRAGHLIPSARREARRRRRKHYGPFTASNLSLSGAHCYRKHDTRAPGCLRADKARVWRPRAPCRRDDDERSVALRRRRFVLHCVTSRRLGWEEGARSTSSSSWKVRRTSIRDAVNAGTDNHWHSDRAHERRRCVRGPFPRARVFDNCFVVVAIIIAKWWLLLMMIIIIINSIIIVIVIIISVVVIVIVVVVIVSSSRSCARTPPERRTKKRVVVAGARGRGRRAFNNENAPLTT